MHIGEVIARAEALGIKPAPAQMREDGTPDGRYVTLRDPPGVYYLVGNKSPRLQIIFLAVPEMAEHFAIQLEGTIESIKLLPGSTDEIPVWSAILEFPPDVS